LDLGSVPAADYFPHESDPRPDPAYPLSMWCCRRCGLAQLSEDDTHTSEPRAVEPEALRIQAGRAVEAVTASGLLERLAPGSVAEFGSPHGGTWLGLPALRSIREADGQDTADIVLDCFGLMHEADQLEAMSRRAARLSPGGVILLQFHSVEAIVAQHQWNALRHGHFAYYSLTSLVGLLAAVGLVPINAWEFALYGKTVLMAAAREASEVALREAAEGSSSVTHILARESDRGLAHPDGLRGLQRSADEQTLRDGASTVMGRHREPWLC